MRTGKPRRSGYIALALVILAVLLMSTTSIAVAQDGYFELRADPDSFTSVGDSIDVGIWVVTSGDGIDTADGSVHWDTAYLTCKGTQPNTADWHFFPTFVQTDPGTLQFICGMLGSNITSPTCVGTFTLKSVLSGSTTIDYDHGNTFLLDDGELDTDRENTTWLQCSIPGAVSPVKEDAGDEQDGSDNGGSSQPPVFPGGMELAVMPLSGPFGTDITLNGGNFGVGGDVAELFINGQDTGISLALNSNGDISSFTMEVADNWFDLGLNEVKATVDGMERTVSFEVTRPDISLEKDQGPRGARVVVIGTGWPTDEDNIVTIKTDMGEQDPGSFDEWFTLEETEADTGGDIETSFRIPTDIVIEESSREIQIAGGDSNGNETVAETFTVIADEDGSPQVENGLAPVSDYLQMVWTFNEDTQEWQVYDIAGDYYDFTALNEGWSYWIEVSEDCALAYGPHTYDLVEGWNLVGWLG